jgi:hypothetical protein
MGDVTLSSAARAGIFQLAQLQQQIDAVQTRLATGKRVNSALDDPAAFFLSEGFKSRASAISALATNITTAQDSLTAANKGVTSIQALLTTAQSIANQALQTAQSLVTVTGNNSSALTTGTVIASSGGSASRFKAGDTVTVSDGTTTATYTASNNDTVQTFLNTINGTAGLKVVASLNVNGQIQLSATSNVGVTIGGTVNGAGGGTLNGILGITAGTTSYVTNTLRQSLAAQFDSLRSQIDLAVQDASFNGVNFLNGSSLSVLFNETGSSKLTITGVSSTTASLGVTASSNQFQLDSDINMALNHITAALGTLQANSASLGAMSSILDARSAFNQAMVDTLNAGADALTLSDENEDSAMLLALQTRQKLAATTLSLIRGSDDTALKLFGL